MNNKFFFFLGLIFYCVTAQAKWTVLAKNGAESFHYIDYKTIKKTSEKTIKVWHLSNKSQQEKNNDNALIYKSSTDLAEYDCQNNTFRVLSTVFHADDMGKGKVVSRDNDATEFVPVPDNTVVADIKHIVCSELQSLKSELHTSNSVSLNLGDATQYDYTELWTPSLQI